MRIFQHDRKHGVVKLQVQDADDLWDLQSVLEPGDLVRGSIERKIKLSGAEEKSRVIKRHATVTVRAEKITFETNEVRVLGPIIEGPEDMPRVGSQSVSITPGTELAITKEWASYQLARLEEATKGRNVVLVVLFDREQAIYLQVTGRGIEQLTTLQGEVAKKGIDENRQSTFYQELMKLALEYDARLKPAAIVLASPAFWQEYAKKQLPETLKKKTAFATISDVEKTAVKELVRRPELQSVLRDNRATLELGYVEEIMLALAHDKLAYGDREVKEVVEQGNIKTVFLTEEKIRKEREKNTFGAIEKLLRQAENAGGAVHIISTEEAGQKLHGLGGLVAMKRW